jgi:septum formation protein
MTFILASGSPRRQALLQRILPTFQVQPAQVSEQVPDGLAPAVHVQTLATRKGEAVATQFPTATVLSADTIVSFQGAVFGKPHSRQQAGARLAKLSGQTHQVYSGVWYHQPGQPAQTAVVCTDVTFYPLTPAQIDHYLATGEADDKAGAYGIQGYGGLFVKAIQGDYYNVMGLPLATVSRMILPEQLFKTAETQ